MQLSSAVHILLEYTSHHVSKVHGTSLLVTLHSFSVHIAVQRTLIHLGVLIKPY